MNYHKMIDDFAKGMEVKINGKVTNRKSFSQVTNMLFAIQDCERIEEINKYKRNRGIKNG